MMDNEKILSMVKEGTISVEEGIKLMEAMNDKQSVTNKTSYEVNTRSNKPKMLRILVDAMDDGKPVNVKVNLPVALIKIMLESNQKFDINGIDIKDKVDIDLILQAIDNDVMGEIVHVDSEEAKVSIFIE